MGNHLQGKLRHGSSHKDSIRKSQKYTKLAFGQCLACHAAAYLIFSGLMSTVALYLPRHFICQADEVSKAIEQIFLSKVQSPELRFLGYYSWNCGPPYRSILDSRAQRNLFLWPYNRGGALEVCGEVAEWLMAPVLKTGILARVSGVRIPPSPPRLFEASPMQSKNISQKLRFTVNQVS